MDLSEQDAETDNGGVGAELWPNPVTGQLELVPGATWQAFASLADALGRLLRRFAHA